MIKQGYLKTTRVEKAKNPCIDYIEDFLNNRVAYLVLQVTQGCNLRCEYCVYSGGYDTRTHTNKRMNYKTAIKAIDFLIEHSKDEDTLYLGFYGGEPLLEFELIKMCVKYINKNAFGKKVEFNITTNATLLTENIVDFLVENNFQILVSLDGPKEKHDLSRKFAGSDEGCFDKLMDNLKLFQSKYPEFYKNRVSFNSVILPDKHLKSIEEFFSTNSLVKENAITSSVVSDVYSKSTIKIDEKYVIDEQYGEFILFLSKLGWFKNKQVLNIAEQNFRNIEELADNLIKYKRCELPKEWQHGGPCVPGMKRLFVNVEGKMCPCEKVSEIADENVIGRIDKGFDMNKVLAILNQGNKYFEKCKDCWIFSLCGVCALNSDMVNNGYCELQKKDIERRMINYIILRKFGLEFV